MKSTIKNLKNISPEHENHQLLEKVIPEESPNQKLKNVTDDEDFFKLLYKYILEFKCNSKYDAMLKQVTSEDMVFNENTCSVTFCKMYVC